jgi:aryl-alcohol dehydrogenase-like predicted oxidoreductase
MLGGALQKAEEGRRASDFVQERVEKHRPQLEQYEAFCEEIGEKPADVALAWLLNNPVVTAPIIGPRDMGQLAHSRIYVSKQVGTRTLRPFKHILIVLLIRSGSPLN